MSVFISHRHTGNRHTYAHAAPAAAYTDLPHYWWTGHLCNHRDHFQKTVIRWVHNDDSKVGRFIFAQQKPYVVGFLAAVVRPGAPTGAAASSSSSVACALASGCMLDIKIGQWMFSDEGFVDKDAEVSVLVEVECIGGTRMASTKAWQPLPQYLDSLPPLPKQPSEGKRSSGTLPRVQANESAFAEHPWLMDFLASQGRKAGSMPHHAGDGGGESEASGDTHAGEATSFDFNEEDV